MKPSAAFFEARRKAVSTAIFEAGAFDYTVPQEFSHVVTEARFAQEFGFTIEYTQKLSPFKVAELWGYLTAQTNIQKYHADKRNNK